MDILYIYNTVMHARNLVPFIRVFNIQCCLGDKILYIDPKCSADLVYFEKIEKSVYSGKIK